MRSCYDDFKNEEINAHKNYGTFQKLYRQKMKKKVLKQYFIPL